MLTAYLFVVENPCFSCYIWTSALTFRRETNRCAEDLGLTWERKKKGKEKKKKLKREWLLICVIINKCFFEPFMCFIWDLKKQNLKQELLICVTINQCSFEPFTCLDLGLTTWKKKKRFCELIAWTIMGSGYASQVFGNLILMFCVQCFFVCT